MCTKVCFLVWWQLIRLRGHVNPPKEKVHARMTAIFPARVRQKRAVQAQLHVPLSSTIAHRREALGQVLSQGKVN